ncbi:hypothetical protein [Pseudonocardia sp.]|uniref:hypothetical protein n=1 Tax=Pseudonocardia sp. TaxID=60912 RepID=UPI003D0C1A87
MSIFKSTHDETTGRADEEGTATEPTRSDVPPDEQLADPDGQSRSSLEGDLAAEGAARTEREGAQGAGEQPVEQSPPGGSGEERGDAAAGPGTNGAAAGRTAATGGARTDDTPERLVPRERAEDYTSRWDRVKSGFVDEPRQAVGEADALVGELLDELQALFAEQRRRLEHGLDSDSTSTEDLRLALRRYRSFFDRLVAF